MFLRKTKYSNSTAIDEKLEVRTNDKREMGNFANTHRR